MRALRCALAHHQMDAESANFRQRVTAAQDTAAGHRGDMQSLQRLHRRLQPAFRILSMPKPRKFDSDSDGASASALLVDDSDDTAHVERSGAPQDLRDKLDLFAQQLSACTRQASTFTDSNLAQLVICYDNIADLRAQSAKASEQLQVLYCDGPCCNTPRALHNAGRSTIHGACGLVWRVLCAPSDQKHRQERSRLQAERFVLFKGAVEQVNHHLQVTTAYHCTSRFVLVHPSRPPVKHRRESGRCVQPIVRTTMRRESLSNSVPLEQPGSTSLSTRQTSLTWRTR
jgi:hypothetical protein